MCYSSSMLGALMSRIDGGFEVFGYIKVLAATASYRIVDEFIKYEISLKKRYRSRPWTSRERNRTHSLA